MTNKTVTEMINEIIDTLDKRYKECQQEKSIAENNADFMAIDIWKWQEVATEICSRNVKKVIKKYIDEEK